MPKNILIVLGAVVVIGAGVIFFDKDSERDLDEEMNLIEESISLNLDEENTLDEVSKTNVKGSCDVIAEGSTCLEYVGSFWNTTNAKLNCSESGSFSTKPCPRPAVGGCQTSGGTAQEVIIWHYDYGGDPFTDELVPYASGACNAVPGGQWIN